MEKQSENGLRTQILFTLDTKKINKLGANWYNIVLDITEYLKSQGFEYSRTLGFVNDRELSEEETSEICRKIVDLALGPKYVVGLDVSIIGETLDLTYLFQDGQEK